MKLNVIGSVCWLICLICIFFTEDKKVLKFFAMLSTVGCIILMLTEVVQ